jgi:protein TonB
VKRIGPAKAAAKVIEETKEEEVIAKPAPVPEPRVEAKPKPKPVSKPKPKPVTKPAPAKPAPVTKPAPVDRAKLLQLMREPE